VLLDRRNTPNKGKMPRKALRCVVDLKIRAVRSMLNNVEQKYDFI